MPTTIFLLHYGLNFPVPIAMALAAILCSVVLNMVVGIRYRASLRLTDREAALYLTYDTIQLAVLLFLTGGLENPFAVLILAPVAVAATLLSLRSTFAVGVVAVICASLIAIKHLPLPWPEPGFVEPA